MELSGQTSEESSAVFKVGTKSVRGLGHRTWLIGSPSSIRECESNAFHSKRPPEYPQRRRIELLSAGNRFTLSCHGSEETVLGGNL